MQTACDLERRIAGKNWPIDSSFINLALLLSKQAEQIRAKPDDDKSNKTSNPDFDWHQAHVNQAEKLYESKTSISLTKLFHPLHEDKNKSRAKVWVLGAAGSGKSTLSQYDRQL